MRDLFTPPTRDERQAEAVQKWLASKGHGTLEMCTGFGKSRTAFLIVERLLSKYPAMDILVVVPTEILKNQWIALIDGKGLSLNMRVSIINTVSKNGDQCDLLIIDEYLSM